MEEAKEKIKHLIERIEYGDITRNAIVQYLEEAVIELEQLEEE